MKFLLKRLTYLICVRDYLAKYLAIPKASVPELLAVNTHLSVWNTLISSFLWVTHILLVVDRRHMVVYKQLIEEQLVLASKSLRACLLVYNQSQIFKDRIDKGSWLTCLKESVLTFS